MAFLDTNVLLRHLLGDHPEHSPRATALIQRIENGELVVTVSHTVIFEVVFNLERRLGVGKPEIRREMEHLIDLPSMRIARKADLKRAFEIYTGFNLPFADACHAAAAERGRPAEIISFDRHFNRVTTITRVEP